MQVIGRTTIFACTFAVVSFAPGASQADVRTLHSQERSQIETSVREQLKDPDSARFRHSQIDTSKKWHCGQVNAKNSYGGYTGWQPFFVPLGRKPNGETAFHPKPIVNPETRELTASLLSQCPPSQ